ncbi:ATP-binding protein [Streptomyces chartreusis]|uniref:ATP-binding protein n=1 Tax=Streptomyces chartreusis TaxID=1969 RepID=UPI00363B959E
MVSPAPAVLAPTDDFASPLAQRIVPLTGCDRPTNVARRAVTAVLQSWAPERTDDMVAGVNEIVINAVQHTEGPLSLVLELHPEYAVARVHDPLQDRDQVTPKTPSLMDQSGRGLRMLDELAEWWFVQPTARGKAVCAAFRITAQENCTR